MRGCSAGGNISRARSSRSINSAPCDNLGRPHKPSLLVIFSFVGTNQPRYQRRHLTPWWVGGHWSSSSDRIHNCELWSRQRSSLRPPHAPKSYLSTHLIHFHQAATPNDDEHELHRRLRSQKASNRSFLRRHGNGREGFSHFWKCTTHAHTYTTHTNTRQLALLAAS